MSVHDKPTPDEMIQMAETVRQLDCGRGWCGNNSCQVCQRNVAIEAALRHGAQALREVERIRGVPFHGKLVPPVGPYVLVADVFPETQEVMDRVSAALLARPQEGTRRMHKKGMDQRGCRMTPEAP